MKPCLPRIALGVLLCGVPAVGVILTQTTNGASDPQNEARIRYARAYLELAEVELQLAEQINKAVPDTLLRNSLERKKSHVKVAEEQLRQDLQ